MRSFAICAVVFLIMGTGRTHPAASGGESLNELLLRAATYVAAYEQQVSGVVAEEDYRQQVTYETTYPHRIEGRHLRSDLLTIPDGAGSWIGFRDVFEVNEKPVRDRNERLSKLFLEPNSGALTQARRIANESARLNLEPEISRTINLPMLALQFLRRANQGRSVFKDAGAKTVDGVDARVLRFTEQGRPRLIETVDEAPATGRFWIAASGRVLRTELFVDAGRHGASVSSLIQVSYGEQRKLNAWLPVSMDETYRTGVVTVVGNARYSNFRQFGVETGIVVKRP